MVARFVAILQDIHQLRATYGQNAGVLQVFGVNDHDSARLVSDLLGQETAVFQSMARALDAEATGITWFTHHVARPLLTPDEVRNSPLDTSKMQRVSLVHRACLFERLPG